jgi:hypothetical protein
MRMRMNKLSCRYKFYFFKCENRNWPQSQKKSQGYVSSRMLNSLRAPCFRRCFCNHSDAARTSAACAPSMLRKNGFGFSFDFFNFSLGQPDGKPACLYVGLITCLNAVKQLCICLQWSEKLGIHIFNDSEHAFPGD